MQEAAFVSFGFHKISQSIPPICQGSSEWQTCPQVSFSPSVMPLAELMKVYSFTCHLLIKMLKGRGPTQASYNTPLTGPVTLLIELNFPGRTYLIINLNVLQHPNSDARPLFLQRLSEGLVNLFLKFPGLAQLLTQFLGSTAPQPGHASHKQGLLDCSSLHPRHCQQSGDVCCPSRPLFVFAVCCAKVVCLVIVLTPEYDE